jgi:HEAT repeat protein
LRIVADRTQQDEHRLKPLVDGSVTALTPSDILLLRRILRDASDEDTIRNEAANHLRANQVVDLADDCSAVLAQAGERPRFRSFAAQHLGIAWLDACAQKAAQKAIALQPRLIALLTDRDVEVRREALLALVRGGDAAGLAESARLLASDDASDPVVPAMRDLALRIAGETKQAASIPRVRVFLTHADTTVRAAAILALGKLGDRESRAAIEAATKDKNLMVAGAAKSALEAIGSTSEPVKPVAKETEL